MSPEGIPHHLDAPGASKARLPSEQSSSPGASEARLDPAFIFAEAIGGYEREDGHDFHPSSTETTK
jgi:hypothetical protein